MARIYKNFLFNFFKGDTPLLLLAASGIFFRIVASLFFVHSDITFVHYFPSKFLSEGVIDIYSYIKANLSGIEGLCYYPPLTYFFLGLSQVVFNPLNAGFSAFIENVYKNDIISYLVHYGASLEYYRYIFFMKIPYFIFDVSCLAIIMKYIEDRDLKIKALKLWLINPVLLYGVYMFGQVDIMAAFTVALGIFLMKQQKIRQGFFVLSLAVLFKTFPIFIIPPVFIYATRSKKDFFKNLIAIITPIILIFIPLYISSGGYVINSVFPKFYAEDTGIFSGTILQKIIFIFFYGIIIWNSFKRRGDKSISYDYILKISLACVLLSYILFFTPVHYFVWAIPLLVIVVSLGILKKRIYWILIILLFIYNLNSPLTTTHLFAPLNPIFFSHLAGLPDIMREFLHVKWGYVMLVARLGFMVVAVVTALSLSCGVFGFMEKKRDK
ncbi:conserved hypothetical protein, membrane [Candidatus Omnitrophus magneticus]|uniref:DUF2029 domain-containing protein n=1 Tax=Candidatus Omnitrophus magneticus TaxID=1609969 RepID=A0A0F0CPQ6_9BACT|nr:conserved hypothetical protein, membrane [Candidatus Omnitrophus magneticus]